jgi:hypothetical protein
MSEQSRAEPAQLCPTCGAELAAGASFCGACGSLVPRAPGERPESDAMPTTVLPSAPTIPPDAETQPPQQAEPAEAVPPASDAALQEDTPDAARHNGHRRWDLGRLFHRD